MADGPDLSDEDLMLAYQGGDHRAFNELYARYSARVYGYLARRPLAADQRDEVFQSIFLKLHRSRGRYSSKYQFVAWLFTICRTTLIDYLRTTKSPVLASVDIDMIAAPGGAGAEVALREALSELPDLQQQALLLRYRDGHEFADIAKCLRTSPANVRQLVSRALRKIRGPS